MPLTPPCRSTPVLSILDYFFFVRLLKSVSDPSSQYFPIYSQISQILIDIFLEVTQLYCPSVKWYLIVVEWFVCPRDTRGCVALVGSPMAN